MCREGATNSVYHHCEIDLPKEMVLLCVMYYGNGKLSVKRKNALSAKLNGTQDSDSD